MTNPLIADWTSAEGLPPFDRIEAGHFRPAFEAAFEAGRAAYKAIADDPDAPTVANTIDAMERADRLLSQVASVFFSLAATDTNEDLRAIQREVSPQLAAYAADILTDPKLFARLEALWAERDALDPAPRRVLELTHRRFVRSGARLGAANKARLKEVMGRLASLGTEFTQKVSDRSEYPPHKRRVAARPHAGWRAGP
ncbi:MAG: peptidase M3, partial [Pseudomonadota bacterium]